MGKLIVAGSDGRMGCEDGTPASLGTGVVDRAACRAGLVDQLQQRERGVSLVEMDRVEGSEAQGAQSAHAANAQHDLLADTHVAVAPIEALRDVAVGGHGVGGDICVQQVERHPTDVGLPDLGLHHPVAQRGGEQTRPAVRAA